MTKDTFTRNMAELCIFFKQNVPAGDDFDAFYDKLKDIPDADFDMVCRDVSKRRQFPTFPSPADFWLAYDDLIADRAPKTSDDLRKKYACAKCYNTPGWITYYRTAEGKRTDDERLGNFTASPCPECDLGKKILAHILEKYGKSQESS
jgi:hypothetical protein